MRKLLSLGIVVVLFVSAGCQKPAIVEPTNVPKGPSAADVQGVGDSGSGGASTPSTGVRDLVAPEPPK